MFKGFTLKDWVIGYFTLGIWILYKMHKNGVPIVKVLGGFVGVYVLIGVLGGIFGDKDKNKSSNTETETVVVEKKVDNAEAERIEKEKAEAERLAKEEEAKKKAEAERLAKETAGAEAQRNQPLQMKITTKSMFISHMTIDSTDSDVEKKIKEKSNNDAVPIEYYKDYFIDYKNGNLYISGKGYTKNKVLDNHDYEIDVNKILHMVISTGNIKGENRGTIKYLNNTYNLTIYGAHNAYDNDFAFGDNRIILMISFEDMNELNKIKDKLISINNSIEIYNENDFTEKVFVKNNMPLCESYAAILLLPISDNERFDRLIEKGRCISSNNIKNNEAFVFVNSKDNKNTMVKVYIDGVKKFLWIAKSDYR